jgi:hypothetical protein
MNKTKSRTQFAGGALSACRRLTLGAAALAISLCASAEAARATEMSPETLRSNLLSYIDQVAELQPYFYDADEGAAAQFTALAEARTEIENIDQDQLADFGIALRGYPGWWQIPAAVRDTLETSRSRSAERATGTKPTADNCADSDDSCMSCPYDGGGLDAIAGLKFPELIAEGVFEIINADLGYNIPNPAKLITGVVLFALRLSRLSVEGQFKVHEECEQQWQNVMLRTNLDATITSRASAGAIQQLQDGVDKLRKDNRRRAIEANMFSSRRLASIVSFVLPASKGGYLEEVADVVEETIMKQRIARGVPEVRNSEAYYFNGEAARVAGDYRAAYDWYREAYRDAVRL